MLKVGVIGYGSRIGDLIKIMLDSCDDVEIVAYTDSHPEYARQQMTHERLIPEKIRFYETAEALLDSEILDGCMIGTRCSGHTPNAVKVLQRDIPLFLEKPVSIHLDELRTLTACAERTRAETVVSFPLRFSGLVQKAKKLIETGEIGEIQHVQAVNNVPYGGVYYHGWYRDESETGGLFLQKATHDFDYIGYILGKQPVEICAMESKQIFKGNRDAGMHCENCPDYTTCQESEYTMTRFKNDHSHGNLCCFSTATGNHDSASAIIRYEDGMHAAYSQNFFARKAAARRGARFIGYKGTLEFDFYTGKIHLYMHGEDINAVYEADLSTSAHFGGDALLLQNFAGMMRGQEDSLSPLSGGILSALLCIKAAESSRERMFKTVQPE